MSQETPEQQQSRGVRLPVSWRPAEEVPVYLGNQFLLQFVGDGYILSFGQITPPAVVDLTEDEAQFMEEIPVHVLGRISMSPERTRALMFLLRRQLERFHPGLLQPGNDEASEEEGEA